MAAETPHYKGHAVVLGSEGAVGGACVSLYKANGWWVGCVEPWRPAPTADKIRQILATKSTLSVTDAGDERCLSEHLHPEADLSVLVHPNKDLDHQEADVLRELGRQIDGRQLDAVVCMAGGYASGGAADDLAARTDDMWRRNVWPAMVSVAIARVHLRPGGLLCLPGTQAALEATPDAVAYGAAKAAIHHLTRSLALDEGALPPDALCVALLPRTIDTVINRQKMPKADISDWTPTKYITDLVWKWSNGQDRPPNGTLVQFVTKNFNTDVTYV